MSFTSVFLHICCNCSTCIFSGSEEPVDRTVGVQYRILPELGLEEASIHSTIGMDCLGGRKSDRTEVQEGGRW